ncbi:MAG: hypothetical protein HQK76_15365 [Desulfobacterales bacterium]|nr:hypothetical protein [Desulfobacterales bacterium]
MIVIPKEKPVILNMNTYYLDIERLFEHYLGELPTGVIYFKAPSAEGAVFFDEDNIISGIYNDKKNNPIEGRDAINQLIEASANNNFNVGIYEIPPETVYFWANLLYAEELHKDLSTEFTDLEGLIKKMSAEKLTGYIEISINSGSDGGYIFFIIGDIIGSTSSLQNLELNRAKENWNILILKSREEGGLFNVKKVSWDRDNNYFGPTHDDVKILDMIKQLLNIFEQTVKKNKKIKADFDTLLKKKFVEKADIYDFLDPFVNEFEYSNGNVKFTGDASEDELLKSITECVSDLSSDLKIQPQMNKLLSPWKEKYSKELNKFGITI